MDERFIPYIPTAGSNMGHAEITSPTLVRMMIKRSKNPVMVLGENLDHEEFDILKRIAKKYGLRVIKTPEEMNLIAIMKLLEDSKNDLALFAGITYYYIAQAVTYLKQFSKVITISIDKYYQPNTIYSFPNLEKKDYLDYLNKILEG